MQGVDPPCPRPRGAARMSDTTPREEPMMAGGTPSGTGTVTAVEVGRPDEPASKAGGPSVGKSPGNLAWSRLRRARLGMTFGVIVFIYIVVATCANWVGAIYGQNAVKGPSEL